MANVSTATAVRAGTPRENKMLGVWVRSKSGYPFRVRDGTGLDKAKRGKEPMFVVSDEPVFLRTKTLEGMINDPNLVPLGNLEPPTEQEYEAQVKRHQEMIGADRAKRDQLMTAKREHAAKETARQQLRPDRFMREDDDSDDDRGFART